MSTQAPSYVNKTNFVVGFLFQNLRVFPKRNTFFSVLFGKAIVAERQDVLQPESIVFPVKR